MGCGCTGVAESLRRNYRIVDDVTHADIVCRSRVCQPEDAAAVVDVILGACGKGGRVGNRLVLKYRLVGFPRQMPRVFVDSKSARAWSDGLSMYTPNSFVGKWSNRILKNTAFLRTWWSRLGLPVQIWAESGLKSDLVDYVERVVDEGVVGLTLYTGSVDSCRKISVLVRLRSGRQVLVKIGDTEGGRAAIRREADTLTALLLQELQVPGVLGLGRLGAYEVLVQTVLGNGGVCGCLRAEHLRFLEAMRRINACRIPLKNVPLYVELREALVSDRPGRLQEWLSILSANSDVVVDCHLAHGDFAPWNIIYEKGRDLRVFDWEDADFRAPAGLDVFHFLYRQAKLVGPWQGLAKIRERWRLAVSEEARAREDILFAIYALREYLKTGRLVELD